MCRDTPSNTVLIIRLFWTPWASGEEIRVEISTKFRPDGLRTELATAGFVLEQMWSDGDFALTLARRGE